MTFHKLTVPQLKAIIKQYNIHTKISGYSKMKKEELIKHINLHLEIVDNTIKKKNNGDEFSLKLPKNITTEERNKILSRVGDIIKAVQKHNTEKEKKTVLSKLVNKIKQKVHETITPSKLKEMFESEINQLKEMKAKTKNYTRVEQFKPFQDLLNNHKLNLVYKKLMEGKGTKILKNSIEGQLTELLRKLRDTKNKYKTQISTIIEDMEGKDNFSYDHIDNILEILMEDKFILNDLMKFYLKFKGNGVDKPQYYTKKEIQSLMKEAQETITKADYNRIKKYLIKQYPYEKQLSEVEQLIFLLRVLHHYESGRDWEEIFFRINDYIVYDVKPLYK